MSDFISKIGHLDTRFYSLIYFDTGGPDVGVQISGVQMSGVQMSGVQMSGVQMSDSRKNVTNRLNTQSLLNSLY